MIEFQPCQPTTMGMHAFIIVMNMVQTITLAYIAQRAVRKNREDKSSNGHSSQ